MFRRRRVYYCARGVSWGGRFLGGWICRTIWCCRFSLLIGTDTASRRERKRERERLLSRNDTPRAKRGFSPRENPEETSLSGFACVAVDRRFLPLFSFSRSHPSCCCSSLSLSPERISYRFFRVASRMSRETRRLVSLSRVARHEIACGSVLLWN